MRRMTSKTKLSPEKQVATLKTWLRILLRGGVTRKAPEWVGSRLNSMGVSMQIEGERYGLEWEWFTYLDPATDETRAKAQEVLDSL